MCITVVDFALLTYDLPCCVKWCNIVFDSPRFLLSSCNISCNASNVASWKINRGSCNAPFGTLQKICYVHVHISHHWFSLCTFVSLVPLPCMLAYTYIVAIFHQLVLWLPQIVDIHFYSGSLVSDFLIIQRSSLFYSHIYCTLFTLIHIVSVPMSCVLSFSCHVGFLIRNFFLWPLPSWHCVSSLPGFIVVCNPLLQDCWQIKKFVVVLSHYIMHFMLHGNSSTTTTFCTSTIDRPSSSSCPIVAVVNIFSLLLRLLMSPLTRLPNTGHPCVTNTISCLVHPFCNHAQIRNSCKHAIERIFTSQIVVIQSHSCCCSQCHHHCALPSSPSCTTIVK